MRVPKWLARIMFWIGMDMVPSILCEGCGREIEVEGRSDEDLTAALNAHNQFFHPERPAVTVERPPKGSAA